MGFKDSESLMQKGNRTKDTHEYCKQTQSQETVTIARLDWISRNQERLRLLLRCSDINLGDVFTAMYKQALITYDKTVNK